MRLIILGAGKYGREIEDIAIQTKRFGDIRFLDDTSSADSVVGRCTDFRQYIASDAVFYVAFGNNEMRASWIGRLKNQGAQLTSIVHPTAYISPTTTVGLAVAVLPQAIINSYSAVRDGCIINSGAIVDHDCVIGECAHICVGAIVKADNHIPRRMKVEAGAVIERETFRGE